MYTGEYEYTNIYIYFYLDNCFLMVAIFAADSLAPLRTPRTDAAERFHPSAAFYYFAAFLVLIGRVWGKDFGVRVYG